MHGRMIAGAMGLLGVLLAAGPAPAQEQAGVTAAVRGKVEIAERSGAVGRVAKSGEPVFLGNAITSGADSGLQILLLDQTTFTIGPNSQITIDEFVYDPKTSAGKVTASIAKGVFRFVTGKVARENPQSMQVRMPTGTIGIRGTIAMGMVDQIDQNGTPTPRQTVLLVGPGNDTEGDTNRGAIVLTVNGQEISIKRTGWGSTLIGVNGEWGPVERFDKALIDSILKALFVGTDQQLGTPDQPWFDQGGMSTNDARLPIDNLNQFGSGLLFAYLKNLDGNRSGLRDMLPTMSMNMANIPNGPSTYDQLRTVSSGQFFYTQSNVPLFDPLMGFALGGSYNMQLDINFGSRTIGGGNSRIDVSIPSYELSGTVPLATAQSFTAGSGLATFMFNQAANNLCGGCSAQFTAQPINQGGVAGNSLAHSLTLSQDFSNVGAVKPAAVQPFATGSGTTNGRLPGQSPQ